MSLGTEGVRDRAFRSDEDALSDHWSDLEEEQLFEEDEWERSAAPLSASAAAVSLAGGLGLGLPFGLSKRESWEPRVCLTPRAHAAAEVISAMIDDPHWREQNARNVKQENKAMKEHQNNKNEVEHKDPALSLGAISHSKKQYTCASRDSPRFAVPMQTLDNRECMP